MTGHIGGHPLAVDRGPVRDAAMILIERSTLAEHVVWVDAGQVTALEADPDGVPFAMWGSGTQTLWRLLAAMSYSRNEVSLYEVAARCDVRNRRAAAEAVAALFLGADR